MTSDRVVGKTVVSHDNEKWHAISTGRRYECDVSMPESLDSDLEAACLHEEVAPSNISRSLEIVHSKLMTVGVRTSVHMGVDAYRPMYDPVRCRLVGANSMPAFARVSQHEYEGFPNKFRTTYASDSKAHSFIFGISLFFRF